ncbi:MAG TPA: hypothetical protein VLN26_00380 [Gaiellaceae bacterium]|nr:hypothetical protein [Gaiellaceae bacterium]
MAASGERAILVVGEQPPEEALLAEAGRYAEVFVLARTVPVHRSRYLVDADRGYAEARGRLNAVVRQLTDRGTRSSGLVGDEDARAARRDAIALFPAAQVLLEAA